jgi:putative tricarboxylic transport membrane protein
VLSVWFGTRKRPGDAAAASVSSEGDAEQAQAKNLMPQIVFTVIVGGLFVYAFFDSWELASFLDKVFPMSVAVVGLIACLVVGLPQLRAQKTISGGGAIAGGSANFDMDANMTDGGPWRFVFWLVGFVGLIGLLGYFLALIVFFMTFTRVVAKTSWVTSAMLTVGAAAMIMVLTWALNMQMPYGLLQEYFYDSLVWPFR